MLTSTQVARVSRFYKVALVIVLLNSNKKAAHLKGKLSYQISKSLTTEKLFKTSLIWLQAGSFCLICLEMAQKRIKILLLLVLQS